MKKSTLLSFLFAGVITFTSCEKSSDSTTTTTTTTSTTSTTGSNTKTPDINEMVINDTLFQFVNVYGNAQSAGDYSYYANYVNDSSSGSIDIRALFNPQPTANKTYNVVTSNTPTAADVQLTLTYDATNSWVAVSGGTVDVKVNTDSTFITFNSVTFRKQGYPNKVVSAKIYSPK